MVKGEVSKRVFQAEGQSPLGEEEEPGVGRELGAGAAFLE